MDICLHSIFITVVLSVPLKLRKDDNSETLYMRKVNSLTARN